MRRSRLACFVAIAFDRKDTDELYSKQIKKALLACKCKPFRVDKAEHNKNINDVIMNKLRECDFVIADLTYARPSVYFEAGFAEGRVPVIYTVRNDHFRARDVDPYGNERVHFDVSMRNIIGWKHAGDSVFQERLRKRIAHVTTPIRALHESDERRQHERSKFHALSNRAQSSALAEAGKQVLMAQGYVALPRPLRDVHSAIDHFPVFAKRQKSTAELVSLWTNSMVNQATLEQMLSVLRGMPLMSLVTEARSRRTWQDVDRLEERILFCTTRRSPLAALKRRFSQMSMSADGRALMLEDIVLTLRGAPWDKTAVKVPLSSTFTVLANIKSPSEFRQALEIELGN